MSTQAMTPKFRVSYPNVFKAKRNELSGKDEYSLVALFPKGADLSALKKAAEFALTQKWGTDKKKWPSNLKTPFRDQAEKAKTLDDGTRVLPDGHEAGAIFMNLKSSQKPGLVDQNREDIIDSSQFYAGCYARATVNAYAYDQAGNRGVSFGLNNLQKMAEGEPFSGRTKAQDDFAAVETGNTGADLFG
jgi:hypothetical protein